MSLLSLVKSAIRRKGLFGPGAHILAAVSGGPDSVCLLHILYLLSSQWDLGLKIAHFEHGLRGQESLNDACFVKQLSKDFGLEFYIGHGDVRGLARKKGMGTEEAARVLRYEFLESIRANTKSTYIATAHTANDQAEEILLRLIRGAGLSGLKGIPWVRNNIVRPMLGITRHQILEHLAANNIPSVTDRSNTERTYLRNRIRIDLLPLLARDFNPAIVRTINRTAELLAEDHRLLEDMADTAYHRSVLFPAKNRELGFSVERIRKYPGPIRRRIYRMALMKLDLFNGRIRFDHLLGIDRLVIGPKDPCGSYRLPGGALASRKYKELFISGAGEERESLELNNRGPIEISGPGCWPAPHGKGHVEISLVDIPDNFVIQGKGKRRLSMPLWLNSEAIRFPLHLRTRRPGERFWPLGAPKAFKLKKFLISRKVPRGIRDFLPLLTNGKEVVAVLGVEIGHPYRLLRSSQRALLTKWIPNSYCI